jgi:hypothetical protein
MSSEDHTSKIMRALVGSTAHVREGEHRASRRAPTVALSRDHGSGGEELARRLAESLGVQCFDRDIVEAIVKETCANREHVERLDEHTQSLLDEWLGAFIHGENLGQQDYLRCLARVLLRITAQGGVVVGRGANLILAHRHVFRVRVTGTPRVCARRLSAAEGIAEDEALRRVLATNEERARFVRSYFRRDINNPTDYDLVVNTDNIGLAEAAEIVLHASGVLAPQSR